MRNTATYINKFIENTIRWNISRAIYTTNVYSPLFMSQTEILNSVWSPIILNSRK